MDRMQELEHNAPQQETSQELRALKVELAPAFDDRFAILGHGTNIQNAAAILTEGLQVRTPLLQTTTVPLENTPKGMQQILHWPHHEHKAIIVLAIPFDAPRNAEFFDERATSHPEELGYILPPRFIRGYIDVDGRKFIPNDKFEDRPAYRLREPIKQTLETIMGGNKDHVDVPAPTTNSDEVDIF